MPFFRFLIHGADPRRPAGVRGFYTTRHAFGATQAQAEAKIRALLITEFTKGRSAGIWRSEAPVLTVEDSWRIGLHQLLEAPNKGSVFYDED